MTDGTIYNIIKDTKEEIYKNVGGKLGMLELAAREALYQVAALMSLIVSIPYIG